MAVAALVVSIVAILVAGISSFYADKSARIEEGSLEIERARRLQERRPCLSGIIKFELVIGVGLPAKHRIRPQNITIRRIPSEVVHMLTV
jgi:hypothetical protein